MNIGSKEEIFETWLSLCPPPPKESPASANLSLQERPSSSDDEEILQEVVKEVLTIQVGHSQIRQDVPYSIDRKIVGKGAFGVCDKVTVTTNCDPVTFAMKTTGYSQGINEIHVLQLAKKENVTEVVGFLTAKLKDGKAYIGMEYVEGGTLEQHVAKGPVPEKTCSAFGKDLLQALKFLHETVGFLHRDIHGQNVLLDGDRTHVKLADFGLAQAIKDTRRWFDDIWQIGCLLLFMLNGKISPLSDERGDEHERLSSVKPEEHFPPQASEEMIELLNLIFGVGQKQLPSAAEILRAATTFN